ncbi:MAG: hypothetical protein WKF61_04250 [Luteimonas sp.]
MLELQHDELQRALAAEMQARNSDHAVARQSLDRAQDLNAELFRVREQLSGSRMDAEENYGRCLDLEAQLREEAERRNADLQLIAALRVQLEASVAQLSEALSIHAAERQGHAQENIQWQAELSALAHAHQEDGVRWQAELAALVHSQQEERTRWQAELAAATRSHQQDQQRWQAESTALTQSHQQERAEWQAESAAVIDSHKAQKAHWQSEFDRTNAQAAEAAHLLDDVLSSRSWRLTRPLRRLVGLMRGRHRHEPQAPLLPPAPGSPHSGRERQVAVSVDAQRQDGAVDRSA